MKVSKHFRREEFACRCGCGFSTVDVELLDLLEAVRSFFGKPVTINSACRCPGHNKSVGGKDGSKHKLGIAADISVKGIDPKEVCKFLSNQHPLKYGIGIYDSFTHVDVRPNNARW